MELVAKPFNFLEFIQRATSKSKQTVRYDRFDELTFKDLREKSETLQQIPKRVDFPTLNELLFDTFNIFYKYNPTFLDDDRIQEEYIINKEMLQKAMKTEEYSKLRGITRLDEVNSAVATATFIEVVLREIRKRDPHIEERIEEIRQMQQERLKTAQQLSDVQNLISSLKQQINQIRQKKPGQQRPQQLNNLQQQLQNALNQQQQLQQQLTAINQQIQQLQQGLKKSVRQIAVSKAIHRASQKAREMNDTIMAFSWGREASTLQKVPAEQRIKLANALMKNRKLLELARELGRMKRLISSARKTKVKRGSEEIYDVTMGNDVARLIPAELAKLSMDGLKLDFFKRFAERQLLQYELRGKERRAKGDFVAVIDLSGSMSGSKEIWAKAVALACFDVAIRQRRGFAVVGFSERVKAVKEFAKDKPPTLEDIIEIAEWWCGGGTNFEEPLTKAMEIIEKRELKKADVLFITDGECEVSDEFAKAFQEFRRKTETRVTSVLIGAEPRVLTKLSDKVVPVYDLVKDSWNVVAEVV